KLLERRKVRIAVVEMHDKSHRDQAVVEMIEKRAAAGAVVERPAEAVLHQAGPMPLRRHLPQLLEADAEFLRLATRIETEARDQRLGEAAAGAFGQQGIFGAQLHAARERILGM